MSINRFHYSALMVWKGLLFSNELITENHKVKEMPVRKVLQENLGTVIEQELNQFYWVLHHNSKRYLFSSSQINRLPIIVEKSIKTGVGQEAYNLITKHTKVNIKGENLLSFRSIVDTFCDFKHSEPNDFKLYRIIILAAWIDRLCCRVCSEPSFGKDSVIINTDLLFNYVNILSNPTLAKMEYSIIGSRLLAINEVSNLNKEEKKNIQTFFLMTAAEQPKYTKRSRARNIAGEMIDISKLSEIVMYNHLHYYQEKDQDHFDSIFTKAVQDRFLPLMMRGQLDKEQFNDRTNIKKIAKEYMKENTAMMKTILWLTEPTDSLTHNYISLLHGYTPSIKLVGRHGMIFDTLFRFIDLYSESQEEATILEHSLHQRVKDYEEQLKEPEDLVVKEERI